MKSLSLKLEENIFDETEQIRHRMKKTRNGYINEALEFYNMLQKRKTLSKELKKESNLVRDESMKILKEFEVLND